MLYIIGMESSGNKDIHSILAGIVSSSGDQSLNSTLEGIILANIINFSDDAIISKTPQGTITSWNKGAEKLFGYSREEVVGKNISILFPKERLDEEPNIIKKIMGGDFVDHYETERLRKDGTLVPISLTVSPLKDASGKIIGISKIARDISSRKKLQEVQSTLSAIVNFSDDAIISETLDGIITSWNRAAEKTFGYSEMETLGKSITILYLHDKLQEEELILDKIRNDEYVHHYETERVRKDGSIVYVSLTVSPIKDAQGKIIGASKIARDISERKRKDEEIEQKNKELESFTYSVSHDLRAPLRRILHYAEHLQEDYLEKLDDEGKRLISRICKNTEKMQQLIDDLLALSHLSKQDLIRSKVDMNSLTQTVLDELVQPQANVTVQVEQLKDVSGDRNLIKQAVENLLTNALKYSRTKERPTIEIGLSTSTEKLVTFFVRDNGVGFDMKYSDKLFNVFQRLHHQNEFEGNGIGLAIVKQIISKHGGKVWAEGNLNEGATFYFSLPEV